MPVRANIEKDITVGELSDFDLEKSFINATSCEVRKVDAEVSQGEDNGKVCDECCKNAAVSQCQKCEAIFCDNCFESVHSTSRTLRLHKAIPLALIHLAGVSTQTCETHEGMELQFYNQTDEKLICLLCVATPTYQSHNIVPIHVLTDKIIEKVKQSLHNVKKVHAQLQKSKGKLLALFPNINTEFSEVVQEIKNTFKDINKRLQAREVNLIKEVEEAYCSKSFPAKLTTEINQQSVKLAILIKQVTAALSAPSIIMKIGETLLSQMADFENIACILSECPVQDFIKVCYPKEFQDTLNSYGTIVSKSSNVKLGKISEQPDDTVDENEILETCVVLSEQSEEQLGETNTSQAKSGSTLLTMPSRQNLVKVSHISTPSNFFIQHVADTQKLEKLMEEVNTYCKGLVNDPVETTRVGNLVCAKSASDKRWYRAIIIAEEQQKSRPKRCNQQLLKVKVRFIDYGKTEDVPLNMLRKISLKFTDHPDIATNCSLIDIVPPDSYKTWPPKSLKAFRHIISDKHLLMGVVRKNGRKLLVDLKSLDTDATRTGDQPASVRDALVLLEAAKFASPPSVLTAEVPFSVQTYQQVALPKEGETLQVTVTHTQTPDAMYVVKHDGDEYDRMLEVLRQMMNVYASENGNQWQICRPYKDMACAAKCSKDQNWCRALITDVTANKMVRVFYVDSGDSEELPFSEIRRLPDHLAKLPGQAMKCRLAGIQSVDEWKNECNRFLEDNCFLHPYHMRVVEAEGDEPMSVILYLPNAKKATSLNQQLVPNSHASLSSSDADCVEIKNLEEPSSPTSNLSIRVSEANDGITSIESEQGKLAYPHRLAYKPNHMAESNQFQFLVTCVDKDCTISGVQPDKRDNSLDDFMIHMSDVCKDEDSTTITQDQFSFNQPCCAKYLKDNQWYRAQIVNFPTLSSVLVEYVDFGSKEEIPLASISLNAAFVDIPKQCISIQLEGLPQTPLEQEKVSKLLEGLLGKTCAAVKSTKLTVNGVTIVEHLTLPDGRDVVDAARDMMSRQREKLEETSGTGQPPNQSPSVETQHYDRGMTNKLTLKPRKSLLADTVLPAEGVPFDVTVTQINTKNVVFLQREIPHDDSPRLAVGHDPTQKIACDHIKHLQKISKKINLKNYFNSQPNESNVWHNMLCCARYTEDDLWYRAQVIEVLPNELARVLYVDYGTSEVVGLERMKPFPAELASLPKQAFQCTVAGLSDENDDTDDDITSIDRLAYATNKKLICKVVSYGPPIVVELYDRVFKEESYQDVPISQRMSMLDVVADDLDNDVTEVSRSSEELSEKEGTCAVKVNDEHQDDQTEDFTVDMKPISDWFNECKEMFLQYDREGVFTRP